MAKVVEIIKQAYHLSGILPTPTYSVQGNPDLLVVAKNLLKLIINKINIDGEEVSLNSQQSLNLTAGVNTVTLPGVIKLIKTQFILGNVRINVNVESVDRFYNEARIVDARSIPYEGYAKRTGDGIDLILYFTPVENYKLEINAIKSLDYLGIDDDITSELELYYSLLVWELANKIRMYNQEQPSRQINFEISDIKRKLSNIKPYDSSIKTSYIGKNGCSTSLYKRSTSGQESLLGGWR